MTVIRPKAFQAIAARHSEAAAPDDARAEPQRGMLEPTVTRLPALRAALEEACTRSGPTLIEANLAA